METVPTLLEQMKPSDFLPLPCLRLQDQDENKEATSSSCSSRSVVEKEGGSDEDDEEDEEEVEEEEDEDEEEESDNSLNPIIAENVPMHPALHKDVINSIAANVPFRINPLVTIISSGDLSKFRNDQSNKNKLNGKYGKDEGDNDSEVFIVHSSYGNETFESVLRQVVIVKKSMCSVAHRILEMFNANQGWRLRATEKDSKDSCINPHNQYIINKWHKSAFIRANDISNILKEEVSDAIQLLSAFTAAGALVAVDKSN